MFPVTPARQVSICSSCAVAKQFCCSDAPPGPGVVHEKLQQMVIDPVPRTMGAVMTDDGEWCERQVSHHVQCLVPHKLVGKAQTFRVGDPAILDENGILNGATQCQAALPQLAQLFGESEGPRCGNLAHEYRW